MIPSSSSIPFSTFALTSPLDTKNTPSPADTTFSLHPSSTTPTDIWRKPANPPTAPVTTFNAPIIYKSLPHSSFSRIRATITADFKILYDQGGLVIVFSPSAPETEKQWIKTGIEFYKGKPFVSTVACDKFADWSLTPLPPSTSETKDGSASVTLELEKAPKDGSLWIYIVDGEERFPIREVTWILDVPAETETWVGVYAATPIMEGRGKNDGLAVKFEGWELDINC